MIHPQSPLPLPDGSQIPIERLAQGLASAPRELGAPEYAQLRVVAYEGEDRRWWSFANCLRLAEPIGRPIVERAGPCCLIQVERPASKLADRTYLTTFLYHWGEVAGLQIEPRPVLPNLNVTRLWSGSPWSAKPAWREELGVEVTEATRNGAVPRVQIFNPAIPFFAESVADASAQWLGLAMLREATSAAEGFLVVLDDNRGWFESPTRSGSSVHIPVRSTTREHLSVAIQRSRLDGTVGQEIVAVHEGGVTMTIAEPLRRVSLFLLTENGDCLDQLQEYEGRRSRRGSSLLWYREDTEPAYRDLTKALRGGEDEVVEFKPWIPTERGDSKFFEVIQVVCALANTRGGSIYIGVSDKCEVLGIAAELRRWGRAAELDVSISRYETEVRRLIGEAISPTVPVETSWITHSNLRVLRIDVPPSDATPHLVVERNEVYVRRGASCRLAHPDEIVALSRTK